MFSKKYTFIRSMTVAVMCFLLVGCAGFKDKSTTITRQHQMPEHLNVPGAYKVTDKNDPVQLIKKGISLSEKGQTGYAADFFGMAAEMGTPTNHASLVRSALFAKAAEHLREGNQEAFLSTMQTLDRRMSKFDQASLTKQESIMMGLYAIARKKPFDSGRHPYELRRLFYNHNR